MGAFRRPRRLQMHQKRIRTDRTSSYRLLQLVRKSLILIRWVWTDCCCNHVFMFLLHLSCTGSDQPGHQNYGTLTWRFSISLFLPSGFSPQLHLWVHPRSSHRSLWIQNQLCINILCAELLSLLSLSFVVLSVLWLIIDRFGCEGFALHSQRAAV